MLKYLIVGGEFMRFFIAVHFYKNIWKMQKNTVEMYKSVFVGQLSDYPSDIKK